MATEIMSLKEKRGASGINWLVQAAAEATRSAASLARYEPCQAIVHAGLAVEGLALGGVILVANIFTQGRS